MGRRLLIDTDVLIDYLRNRPESVQFVEALETRAVLSVITVAELYAGVRDGKEYLGLLKCRAELRRPRCRTSLAVLRAT